MSTITKLLAAGALSLAIVAPAVALNPQPLPPGFRLNPQPLPPGLYHGYQPRPSAPTPMFYRLGRGIRIPHCHGVQFGDPRTHPPVRVCS